MATPSFSTNIGLSASPEYDQSKDSALYAELVRIRNAFKVIQGALDSIPGFGGTVVNAPVALASPNIILGAGTQSIRALATTGNLGQVLTSQGALLDPIWLSLHFNTQTANYQLAAVDYDDATWVEMNVAGACTLTIPPDATVLCPTGYTVLWSQLGAGQITFTPGSGAVNIRNPHSLTSFGQYAAGGLTKTPRANEWELFGDVT